jgi:hypothetical protein
METNKFSEKKMKILTHMYKIGLKNSKKCYTYMPTARLGPSKSVPSSRIKINVTYKIKIKNKKYTIRIDFVA